MSSAFALTETDSVSAASPSPKPVTRPLRVQAFTGGHQDEVLAFLARRPIHTVFMSGLIRDNGLVSFANRGTFYGCRDKQGSLNGVALIGPKTVIEASDDEAFKLFAGLVPNNLTSHLIRGEKEQIDYVLEKYEAADRTPRLVTRELLLEQTKPAGGVNAEPRLRLAHAEDLESVISINAALAFEETGLNPLLQDGQGMWARTSRRIDQGRVWILVEKERLMFKADIISETPETVFVEGVFVPKEERRKGYGLRCMTQLARNLIGRFESVSLVVNEENSNARQFYTKLNFQTRSPYSTAYFSAV
ncbi:MAG TPA: GNAT family N-acetyltransferase [Pyrinomonadaceae bacterium]|nr:GNAT family N-acetyltransferase [Pyrinomonadaceae bacterium]